MHATTIRFDLSPGVPESFAPHHPRRPDTRLFDLKLRNATRASIADEIVWRALMRQSTRVSFVNAHCINSAMRDADYAAALAGSQMLLPDGSGMRLAAMMARAPMGDNLNGTDLFPELCQRADDLGLPIFLLGGQPGIAAAAAAAMVERYPGLIVAGTRDGYFAEDDTAAVIDQINASGAALLFVGMGVPTQEKWIAAHGDKLAPAVTLAVGGLFDYYSGRIPRAPWAIRAAGCEWIWRLAQEPRRLARRYTLGNMRFIGHAIAQAARVHGWSEWPKRAIDLGATLSALFVALPILLLVALAIKLEDRGPVFFRQRRIGRNGRPFNMYKFRSMVVNAEALRAALLDQSERDSVCFKMKRDPRVTRVGAFLRRWSLDELPQLINVMRGEMSLVGPRPALPVEVAQYDDRSFMRLGGAPGLTCTWQVSGRAEIPFEQQVEMDIAYLEKRGLMADLSLLLRTIPAVVTARGAY